MDNKPDDNELQDKPELYLKKMIKALEKKGLKYDDFRKYHYAGSDNVSGMEYYRKLFPDRDYPKHIEYCLCNTKIKNNYYITDDTNILVLGSCCIKKFVDTGLKKVCSNCKSVHRNRKDNYCNACRSKKFNYVELDNQPKINNAYDNVIKIKQYNDTNKLYNMCSVCMNDKVKKPYKMCYPCIDKRKEFYHKCAIEDCNKLTDKKYIYCFNHNKNN